MLLSFTQAMYDTVTLFAIFTTITGAILFYQAYRQEAALQASWRAIGFGSLSLAFICGLPQLHWPFIYEIQLLLEAFGFVAIYRGMTIDPYVSYLSKASSEDFDRAVDEGIRRNKQEAWVHRGLGQFSQVQDPDGLAFTVMLLGAVFGGLSYAAGWIGVVSYVAFPFLAISFVYVVRTLVLQAHRLFVETNALHVRMNNVYPFVGYLFFAMRVSVLLLGAVLMFIPNGREWLPVEVTDGVSIVATFCGLLCIALWLWSFVRARAAVRTYVIAMAILMGAALIYLWM